jgi:hypothetical protein
VAPSWVEFLFRVEGNRAVLARTPDFLEPAGSTKMPAAKHKVARVTRVADVTVAVYYRSGYTSLMARAVSVRLDDEVQRALNTLEATGLSRSEAIRRSILDAASALRRREALRAEVASLEADEDDRQEMQAVAALMESLRATR